jgi:hypothetical protein
VNSVWGAAPQGTVARRQTVAPQEHCSTAEVLQHVGGTVAHRAVMVVAAGEVDAKKSGDS